MADTGRRASESGAEFTQADSLTAAFGTLVHLYEIEARRDNRNTDTLVFDIENVGESLALSPRQVQRHLVALSGAGWLIYHRKQRNGRYSVTFPYEEVVGGAPIKVWLRAWAGRWPDPPVPRNTR